MTSYGGRRAPNVSQYLANLNTLQDSSPTDELLTQDDLSLFATTDFFDFDMGDGLSRGAADFEPAQHERKQNMDRWQEHSKSAFMNNEFQFPDLANFPSVTTDPNAYFPLTSPTTVVTSPVTPRVGEKRKAGSMSENSSQVGHDGDARVAAEEDKRRRNTAASARFRIKKKQREQALEQTAKKMTEKASKLETKVAQLEMENKWLKSIITEKNDMKGDFQELYEKFTKERSADERSSEPRTDGVGTSVDEDFDDEE